MQIKYVLKIKTSIAFNDSVIGRDMQLPPVFLIIPKGYPQTPVGFHRVELDIGKIKK